MKELPIIGNILQIIDQRPRISAWVVLSIGIIALLIYEGRDVDLTFTNWVALIVASVLVSGLCIWIVSWEDEEMEKEQAPPDKMSDSDVKLDKMETDDD